jgi:hypothetical protein
MINVARPLLLEFAELADLPIYLPSSILCGPQNLIRKMAAQYLIPKEFLYFFKVVIKAP